MYPTLFKLPLLPDWLADVKSYGVMMMIAFLSGTWFACRRASKSQADPDIVINICFISLVCGIIGSRAMFVLHYWDTHFAIRPNPLLAVFDIRAGGLEFWGGPLLVIPALMIYLRYVAKVSVRWYLDITMPSLAWGLAITRIGCFLNGCCWGAVCVDQHDPAHERASVPWAVRFPYGSPAMVQQYKFGQLTLPKELILTHNSAESAPLPRDWLKEAVEHEGPTRQESLDAKRQADRARAERLAAGADEAELKSLKASADKAAAALTAYDQSPAGVVEAQCRTYGLTLDELTQLASHYRSKPVHPAQLYAVINGLIISWVLTLIFYRRRRHGVVGAWFLIFYSISRVFLELIRQDNPLDMAGLTISQAISIGTFSTGVLWLLVVHKLLPERSPRVVPFIPPDDESPPPVARKQKKR
ncbi:MAG: prolipoprotein diacylglyceryl transferase family protein [Planctomycetota bacterium]